MMIEVARCRREPSHDQDSDEGMARFQPLQAGQSWGALELPKCADGASTALPIHCYRFANDAPR